MENKFNSLLPSSKVDKGTLITMITNLTKENESYKRQVNYYKHILSDLYDFHETIGGMENCSERECKEKESEFMSLFE